MQFKPMALVAGCAFAATAHSQVVEYTAPGGSFAPTTVHANATASDLNAIGSSADLLAGGTFLNTVFLEQLIVSPDPASAVANDQYFQFTAGVESGFEMDLSNLTFDAAKGGVSSPRGWVLRSSLDGFGVDIASGDIPTVRPNVTNFSVDLSAPLFQDLTSDVTFRIYGYAPTAVGVGSFFDSIAPVPEPATIAGLALGVLALRRRKKQKKA